MALAILNFLILLILKCALVDGEGFVGAALPSSQKDGQLCGLYAVFGAAKSIGADVDFASLLDMDYVSSIYGSTEVDLHRCIESIGLEARHFRNLGATALHATESPLILHVASHGQMDAYDHWVLFLGMQNETHAKVVESDGKTIIRPLAEVLARWDGIAIGVERKGHSTGALARAELSSFLLTVFSAALVVLISFEFYRLMSYRWPAFKMVTNIGILGVILAAGIIIHSTSLADQNVIKSLEIEAGSRSVPELTTKDLIELRSNTNTLQLVDSRFSRDFAMGSIDLAVNIPVDSTYGELVEATKRLSKHAPVVVFCQSDNCNFSDQIARRLVLEGFENVQIYRDGWVDWSKRQ